MLSHYVSYQLPEFYLPGLKFELVEGCNYEKDEDKIFRKAGSPGSVGIGG